MKREPYCSIVRKCRRLRQHKLTLRGNLKAIRLKANNADFNKKSFLYSSDICFEFYVTLNHQNSLNHLCWCHLKRQGWNLWNICTSPFRTPKKKNRKIWSKQLYLSIYHLSSFMSVVRKINSKLKHSLLYWLTWKLLVVQVGWPYFDKL